MGGLLSRHHDNWREFEEEGFLKEHDFATITREIHMVEVTRLRKQKKLEIYDVD